MTWRRAALVLLLLFASSCVKVYPDQNRSSSASPTAPTPTPAPAATRDKIEFRVFGSNIFLQQVTVRHTDPINGVTLYTGGVPYFAAVDSTNDSLFLFIEGSASGNLTTSTLQVQIFVNGKLFREGFSQGFTLFAAANGTFRR